MIRALVIIMLLHTSLAAADYRTLVGQHIVLRTDVPANPEVDALPSYFDQAFGQWCDYFGVDAQKHAQWRVNAVLMKNAVSKERFLAAGLIPKDLWDFKSGFSQGTESWLYDQTSPYYRRHLLLHEGVHCFMNTILGGSGPPWYAEGMAELLATHKLEDGRLTINYFPRSPDEVPKLGRIEMVQHAVAEGRSKSLGDIANYSSTAHRENEPYGWCWAAAAFLDGHPRYQKRFRKLPKALSNGDFSRRLANAFAADRQTLAEDWQIFLANLDHGYDFERNRFENPPATALAQPTTTVEIAADRGWQSSGIVLERGRRYRITAKGRFQVAHTSKPWVSEPGGVTIRYVQGRPLGMLLAAVRPSNFDPLREATPLAKPIAVGLGTTLEPQQTGTLYLRINDAPGELADNAGTLSVTITALPN